jgi:hypothetical protein
MNCVRKLFVAVLEYHREHGYIPLSQVVLHTTDASGQAPDPHNLPPLPPGLRRHLVVIHNQTFCITLRDTDSCPANEQCMQGDTAAAAPYPHVCRPRAQAGEAQGGEGAAAPPHPPHAILLKPPTYEEATDGPVSYYFIIQSFIPNLLYLTCFDAQYCAIHVILNGILHWLWEV